MQKFEIATISTCASSSLKSLILLSDEELTAVASAWRKASSDAYFRTYSDTFFLYSSGLKKKGKKEALF